MKRQLTTLAMLLAMSLAAFAQGQGQNERRMTEERATQERRMRGPGGPDGFERAPMPPGMKGGGKWWKNSELVQKVGVSDQQVTQMEQIFQNSRTKLVDLRANLEKAEMALEPLMEADNPNEAQIGAAIDRVSQARAALEKEHAMMLVGIRKVLTLNQWKKLQEEERNMRPPRGAGEMRERRPMPPGGEPRHDDEE
jgi:Spy/CpxP family protein refolding chaperone